MVAHYLSADHPPGPIVIAARQLAANWSRCKISPAFAPARPKLETVRTGVRGRQLFLEPMLEVYEATGIGKADDRPGT